MLLLNGDQGVLDSSSDSFQQFLTDNNLEAYEGDYIYDGDIFFSSDEVNRLYEENLGSRGNIAINSSGGRYLWTNAEKEDITYRFITNMSTFSLTDTQVRNAFREAASAWNGVGGVSLREVNSGGVFMVQAVNVTSGYTAMSFFPNSSYDYSIHLSLRYVDNTYNTYKKMVGLFTYEIGHFLGLAHEHQRADSPNQFNQSTFGEAFDSFDSNSVMNYANRPYTKGISVGDRALIHFLYYDLERLTAASWGSGRLGF